MQNNSKRFLGDPTPFVDGAVGETLLALHGFDLAKISAVSRKLVQPKRTIKQNVLRGKMSISTSG